MTTSISSEARRNQTSVLIGAEKITFPPKPDGQTDIRTVIIIYRVASLLIIGGIPWPNAQLELPDKIRAIRGLVCDIWDLKPLALPNGLGLALVYLQPSPEDV